MFKIYEKLEWLRNNIIEIDAWNPKNYKDKYNRWQQIINDLEAAVGEMEEELKVGWIPVENQLPRTNENVLLQVSGKPKENITLDNALEIGSYDTDDGWMDAGRVPRMGEPGCNCLAAAS